MKTLVTIIIIILIIVALAVLSIISILRTTPSEDAQLAIIISIIIALASVGVSSILIIIYASIRAGICKIKKIDHYSPFKRDPLTGEIMKIEYKHKNIDELVENYE